MNAIGKPLQVGTYPISRQAVVLLTCLSSVPAPVRRACSRHLSSESNRMSRPISAMWPFCMMPETDRKHPHGGRIFPVHYHPHHHHHRHPRHLQQNRIRELFSSLNLRHCYGIDRKPLAHTRGLCKCVVKTEARPIVSVMPSCCGVNESILSTFI